MNTMDQTSSAGSDSQGNAFLPLKALNWVIVFLSLVMVVYHFVYVRVLILPPNLHANVHLGFGLVLTYLIMIRRNPKWWYLKLVLVLLSLVCILYIHFNYHGLLMRLSFNTAPDLFIGAMLVILCLIGCYQAAGPVLPALAIIFILYAFFGYLIPGPLQAMQLEPSLIISRLSLSFGISGIFGYLLTISATLIFMFMVFAMLVSATGAVEFFSMIGDWVSQKFRAGPAMAAVFTSALVGSVSGLPGPNVMITGSFTIPAMQKNGYPARHAGGIETAASTCGPIVPPVMGIVAFVMVGFTGIAYKDIVAVAILPALLYIFSMALYVTFQAGRMGIQKSEPAPVDKRKLLLLFPAFFGPLAILTLLLLLGFTPSLAAFWATIILLGISLLNSETRPSFSTLIDGLCRGAEIGSKVACICAVLGLIIITITMTGLGVKLPSAMVSLCGDNLLLLLVFTFLICLILGCGLPTSAAYILVAITCAPILVKQGIPRLEAHYFVLYAAVFANITPPIAIPAIFASQISGGKYMETSIEAAKAGLAGFLLPFLIVFVPSLIFGFSQPVFAVLSLISCPLMLFGFQQSITGYFVKRLDWKERLIILISPVLFMIYIYLQDPLWFVSGFILMCLFIAWQLNLRKKEKAAYA